MKNSNKKMEYKKIKVPFAVKEENITEEEKYFIFEGYASTFGNIDSENDIINKGAFLNTLQTLTENDEKLPVLWQHNTDMPLGIYLQLQEDEKGLFVKARLPKDDTFVTGRVIPQMRIGSVRKLSIGFFIKDFELVKETSRILRVIKEAELKEISIITIPANTNADITHMKRATTFGDLPLAPRSMEWDSDNALGRVRRATNSTEEPSFQYKKAFFWYDEDREDQFGGYKLPFADVIDGQLKAVPRGVFAAAAAIRGARGGVDIPDQDRNRVIEHINRYYAKMRQSFGDDNIISPFERDSKDMIRNSFKLSDVEYILKLHDFSNKESQMLISKIHELKCGDHINNGSDRSEFETMLNDLGNNIKKINMELAKNGY